MSETAMKNKMPQASACGGIFTTDAPGFAKSFAEASTDSTDMAWFSARGGPAYNAGRSTAGRSAYGMKSGHNVLYPCHL